MAHSEKYTVRLGGRGRLVLPAQLRRIAGLHEGDELLVVYSGGILRLVDRRALARAGRGMFASVAPDRDLIGELLAERRDEARRETHDGPVPPQGRA
jgi:bifunctional DNA-binding transcriptional regulator/antitoxin component of YhaV-PrlF toxin-antitoxin module